MQTLTLIQLIRILLTAHQFLKLRYPVEWRLKFCISSAWVDYLMCKDGRLKYTIPALSAHKLHHFSFHKMGTPLFQTRTPLYLGQLFTDLRGPLQTDKL